MILFKFLYLQCLIYFSPWVFQSVFPSMIWITSFLLGAKLRQEINKYINMNVKWIQHFGYLTFSFQAIILWLLLCLFQGEHFELAPFALLRAFLHFLLSFHKWLVYFWSCLEFFQSLISLFWRFLFLLQFCCFLL